MLQIQFGVGDELIGMDQSIKTYLFYIAPTGKLYAFKDSPARLVTKNWQRYEEQGRFLVATYELDGVMTVKLRTTYYRHGMYPVQYEALFDLYEDGELFQIQGLQGFGFLKSRGCLNPATTVPVETLQEQMNYEFLSDPKELPSGRKIFWKYKKKK